jgi:hypothetical protein
MFGDRIKYICGIYWRFIIDVNDRQQGVSTSNLSLRTTLTLMTNTLLPLEQE